VKTTELAKLIKDISENVYYRKVDLKVDDSKIVNAKDYDEKFCINVLDHYELLIKNTSYKTVNPTEAALQFLSHSKEFSALL